MNFKCTSYTVLIFWITFLGNASTSCATGSAAQYLVCDGRKFIVHKPETFPLRENYRLAYKINFNKTITHARCSNEVTNASLKFCYIDGTNNFGAQSTLVASKETAGKWNCKIWMTENCILEYSFQVKLIHFHIKTSIEDTFNSTIQHSWSIALITAKGDNFWIQFTSDFPIVSASCIDVNGNGQLSLKYIDSSSKKSINSYIQATNKVKGPWNCSFDDDLRVRKFVLVKVIWKPSTLSTPTTTTQLSSTFSTTTERKSSTLSTPRTTQLSTTLSTTTETTGLSSSTHRGKDIPTALTKTTTEAAQNKDDKDNSATPLWLTVGSVVALLVIIAVLIIEFFKVYRRKAQIPTTAPQPEAPLRIEQSVYYTIHGDDYNEEYSYAYAYARQEPLRTNVACNNTLYDISNK